MSRQVRWTARRRSVFLKHLRATGNVTAAAEAAKLSRSRAYSLRAEDAEFRQAWDDAMEGALDDLEAELRRRVLEGTEKPVFYRGKPVGSVRSYSDNLALYILRSRRPQAFGEDGAETSDPGSRRERARDVRRRLEERLARHGQESHPAKGQEPE